MNKRITAIILTYNETLHIERCIKSLIPVVNNIVVVDSYSTDRTVEIAQSLGATVIQNKWVNYSVQFQWALDNCVTDSDWVMRIDADEYVDQNLQDELMRLFKNNTQEDVDGFYVRRKVIFAGKWIKHGGFYPLTVLRIWRKRKGRIEQRWMDEHIVLSPNSKTMLLKGNIVDHNQKGITFWINKHNSYATREMVDLLNVKYHMLSQDTSLLHMQDPQAKWKRMLKDNIYSKAPVGVRSTLYFMYRYIFRLGFLDGPKGFYWHFMQGYWYRMLVDLKINEIETKANGDVEKIRILLQKDYGIDLHDD